MVLTNQLIYLVNVKSMRKIFTNFVCFSKSPNLTYQTWLWNFTNSGEELWAAQRVIFQKMVDISTTIACKDKRKVKKCLKLKKKGKCTKKRVWKKCKKTCNKCWDLKTRQYYIQNVFEDLHIYYHLGLDNLFKCFTE